MATNITEDTLNDDFELLASILEGDELLEEDINEIYKTVSIIRRNKYLIYLVSNSLSEKLHLKVIFLIPCLCVII